MDFNAIILRLCKLALCCNPTDPKPLLQPSYTSINIHELPPDIIFNIFTKIPVKSLARMRCVSKLWYDYINDDRFLQIIQWPVEEPTPIMFHLNSPLQKPRTLCFHLISNSEKEGTTANHVLKPNNDPLSRVQIRGSGSCNGLLCLSQEDGRLITNLVVFYPLKNECHKLPSLPSPLFLQIPLIQESFGLGFDDSTNTFKMVCVLVTRQVVQPVKLCAVVHEIGGTRSWQKIPQVPPYPVGGEAVFANGCLYWLVSYLDRPSDDTRKVICFDVREERFGLISSPETVNRRRFSDQLVDLNGEVGLVCYNACSMMEVWVLRQKDQWVLHCSLKMHIPNDDINVLGFWNKEGDILMKITENGKGRLFIYSMKSGVLHGVEFGCDEAEAEAEAGVIMYRKSKFHRNLINKVTNSCLKADLRKTCCLDE